jgi:TctA family transporter
MSQRGEGGKAIVLATNASFIGGMIGISFWSSSAPNLQFRSPLQQPEYFALHVRPQHEIGISAGM